MLNTSLTSNTAYFDLVSVCVPQLFSVSLAVLVLPELLELALVARGHRGLARGPGGGADLAVLISVLEGAHKAEGLVHVATDGKIVHRHVAERAFAIYDIGSAKGDAGVGALLNEAAEVAGDLVGDVGEHGDLHGAKASLLAVLLGVLHVGEVGVDGDADELDSDYLEAIFAEGLMEGGRNNLDAVVARDVVD